MDLDNPALFRFASRAVHAGQPPDRSTGALMTPIYQNSTYAQPAPAQAIDGYDYGRTKNPTRHALERNLASLEEARFCAAFSSGMAAINTAVLLLKSGDHVVAGDDLYGGTWRLFERVYRGFGLTFRFVDATDPAALKAALSPATKMVYVETPSNPLLRICDLEQVAAIAHSAGALAVCDNTFATPYLQQPLRHGFDLVIHSTTKYLGGHSDVIGGALLTSQEALHERIRFLQNAVGAVPGPLDCFLVLRGTKTLHLRMERHSANALQIAQFLEVHPDVAEVFYPGLSRHPGHAIAARQMAAFGGMISFVVRGDLERAKRVASSTSLFALAESLGGVESLIEHPPSMTHASIPRELRLQAGLQDGLIRLSVGVEHADDLVEDLRQALAAG